MMYPELWKENLGLWVDPQYLWEIFTRMTIYFYFYVYCYLYTEYLHYTPQN